MKTKLLKKFRKKAAKQIFDRQYLIEDRIWYIIADKLGNEVGPYSTLEDMIERLEEWRRIYILSLLMKAKLKNTRKNIKSIRKNIKTFLDYDRRTVQKSNSNS